MTNPWADAASRDFVSESSFNMDETRAIAKQRRQERRRAEPEMGCGERARLTTVKAFYVMDFIVGFSLLIYGLVISSSPATAAVALVYLTSISILVRASLGLSALYTNLCHRYGLVMSAYLSPLFGSVLFISSMLCWALHNEVFGYLEKHAHQLKLPTRFVRYWAGHSHAVWVTLLLLAVLEGIRWLLERRLREQLLDMDESFDHVSVRSNHRPWWWRRSRSQSDMRNNDGLGDPLLSPGMNPHWSSIRGSAYEVQDGVVDLGREEPKRGWLSRMFGRRDQQDDISDVDFESVQEEWVSRSEEDPLWWSREDEERSAAPEEVEQKTTNSTSEEEKTDSVSWAETTDV